MWKRKEGEPYAAQAARNSLFIPLVLIAFNVFASSLINEIPAASLLFGIFFMLGYLVCFGLAIYALIAMRKHGRKGILGFALGGLCLNFLILAAMVWGFVMFPKIAADALAAKNSRTLSQMIKEAPRVFPEGTQVIDEMAGLAFEVPPSLEKMDPAMVGPNFIHSYTLRTDDRVISVGIERLGGRIPKGAPDQNTLEGLKSKLPPGTEVEVLAEDWMGHAVYGILMRIPTEGGLLTTITYQIPLQREAVQLIVIDTAKTDAELTAFAGELLKGVKGPSSW